MATRRRTRRNDEHLQIMAWALVLPVILVIALIGWLIAHPVAGIAFLVCGGALVYVINMRVQEVREERAQVARQQAAIAHAQSMEIARYHAMGPREFEDAIAYLCHRDGCHNARRVGGANDLGADVLAVAPDGRRIVIQCKRYGPTNKVGSQDAQRFGGTCYAVHGADVAAVVTTSVFTRPAAQYLATMGIRLFDERALAAWASRTGPAPWHQ